MVIYLDHAATTAVDPIVVNEMLPFFGEFYGNPSSNHDLGLKSLEAVSIARDQVSVLLNCTPSEVIFTASGSESNNLAIKGTALRALARTKAPHIITSQVEHESVLASCEQLVAHFGCRVTRLPVDRVGRVDPDDLRHAVDRDTILVSIMHANNEIGTIQPIEDFVRICRKFGVPFHTDAVQAVNWLNIGPSPVAPDLTAISAHKFYGPKGVGALFVRSGIQLVALLAGGGQEFGLRSGTENVPLIVGIGAAASQVAHRREEVSTRVSALRDRLISGIMNQVKGCFLTGDPVQRLPNHASFVFEGVDAGVLLTELNSRGVLASSGSACASRRGKVSHVLAAIGVGNDLASGSLRLTLGAQTSEVAIEHVVDILPPLIGCIRRYMPSSA